MKVKIETIDDVLPFISNENGMVVAERDEYTVVNYAFVNDKTFTNPVACECRGLKFDLNGQILARPFHKFFNIGERQAPEDISWDQPHVIMDKLDGSMIHPCILNSRLVFMSRMGETSQAKAAYAVASDAVKSLCLALLADGITPIFEFTSPESRIVVSYDKPEITLLALRETISGSYHNHAELKAVAEHFGVPLVNTFGQVKDVKEFVENGRALKGVEGYVVAFDDGHRVKLKADAYVLRHKALAGVSRETNLLAWIVEDALDDVLPILHKDIASQVKYYNDQVLSALSQRLTEVENFISTHANSDRREFASAAQKGLDKRLHSTAFSILDGRDGREVLVKILKWASHSESRVDTVRDLFAMEWSAENLNIRTS